MKKRKPKKLKTMNEISAEEGFKLFRAAMVPDAAGRYCLRPEGLPDDIGARDCFEFLKLGSEICSKKNEYSPKKIAANITGADLEKLPTEERRVVYEVWDNFDISDKGIAVKQGKETKTISAQLGSAYRRLQIKGGRKTLIAMLRQLPPKT